MFALETWARDTAVRAVKTFGQTFVALLGTDVAGLLNANWGPIALTSLLAAVVSVLHNLASLDLGDGGSAELDEFYSDVLAASHAGEDAADTVDSAPEPAGKDTP